MSEQNRPTPEQLDELSGEELSEFLGDPRLVYARVRDRRTGHTGRMDVEAGSVPATPDGLRELRRELVGGPGGPPSGTGKQYADVVAFVRTYDGEPTQENVAAEPGMPGERQLSRIARPYGGWRALLKDAGRA